MPFDPSNYAVSKNGVEIGKLRVLSEALKGEMPQWRWDFTHIVTPNSCGTAGCAIGLARHLGLIQFEDHDAPDAEFGLSFGEMGSLFYTTLAYGGCAWSAVTPNMVADAIDRIIAREEAA